MQTATNEIIAASNFADQLLRDWPNVETDNQRLPALHKFAAVMESMNFPRATILDCVQHANSVLCAPKLPPEQVWLALSMATNTPMAPEAVREMMPKAEPLPAQTIYVLPKVEQDKLVSADEIPKFKLAREIKPLLDRSGLVEGLLSPNAISLWYGPSNVYKTSVLLDLASCVAAGRDWFNRKTQQIGVLYLAAEGGAEIVNRVAAIQRHYGVTDFPMAVCEESINLCSMDAKPANVFMAMVRQAEVELGHRIGLVIIDTMNATFGSGDENSTKDMTTYKNRLLEIKNVLGAHIAIVHHVGKDASRGARGSSAMLAAVDTAIEFKEGGQLFIRKQRDMEKDRPFGFSPQTIEIGTKASGAPVTSCIVVPCSLSASAEFGLKPIRAESPAGKALTVLGDLTMAGHQVRLDDWQEAFIEAHYKEKRKVGATAFRRAAAVLRNAQRITENEGVVSLAE